MQVFDDSIEPQTCSQCPFWTESDRTPNVGYCKNYDDKTLGHDRPDSLCIVQFWNFAATPEPALQLALA